MKTHRRDVLALPARLRLAAHLPGIFLPPTHNEPISRDGRLLTTWPLGTPVDPADPPWEEAARLLALLHLAEPPPHAPGSGAPGRLARAISRLDRSGTAGALVHKAHDTLPPLPYGHRLIHGDWHLGQLIRASRGSPTRTEGGWRLIDVDDLGLGAPAWDLARPAALFAAGLIDPPDWETFLTAYRSAGGPAVGDDPWDTLDVPARALAVQLAATALVRADSEGRRLSEEEEALVDTCKRIGGTQA